MEFHALNRFSSFWRMLVKTRGHAFCVEVMWLFDTWCDFREVAWPCSDVTFGGVMWLRAGARTSVWVSSLMRYLLHPKNGARVNGVGDSCRWERWEPVNTCWIAFVWKKMHKYQLVAASELAFCEQHSTIETCPIFQVSTHPQRTQGPEGPINVLSSHSFGKSSFPLRSPWISVYGGPPPTQRWQKKVSDWPHRAFRPSALSCNSHAQKLLRLGAGDRDEHPCVSSCFMWWGWNPAVVFCFFFAWNKVGNAKTQKVDWWGIHTCWTRGNVAALARKTWFGEHCLADRFLGNPPERRLAIGSWGLLAEPVKTLHYVIAQTAVSFFVIALSFLEFLMILDLLSSFSGAHRCCDHTYTFQTAVNEDQRSVRDLFRVLAGMLSAFHKPHERTTYSRTFHYSVTLLILIHIWWYFLIHSFDLVHIPHSHCSWTHSQDWTKPAIQAELITSWNAGVVDVLPLVGSSMGFSFLQATNDHQGNILVARRTSWSLVGGFCWKALGTP